MPIGPLSVPRVLHYILPPIYPPLPSSLLPTSYLTPAPPSALNFSIPSCLLPCRHPPTYLLARPFSLHHMRPLPTPSAFRPPPSPAARTCPRPPVRPAAPMLKLHIQVSTRSLRPPRYSRAEAPLGLPASLFSAVPCNTCLLPSVPAFPLIHSLPASYPRVEPRQRCIFRAPHPTHTYTCLPAHPFPPFEYRDPHFCHRCLAPRVEAQSTRRPLLRSRESRPSCLGLVAPLMLGAAPFTVAPATPAPWHKLLPNTLRRERIVASRRENGVQYIPSG
jgi:hypothetical protein